MKCFTVYTEEIQKRLDPLFYSRDVFQLLKETSYEVKSISEVTKYLKTGFPAGGSSQSEDEMGIIQIRPTNIDRDCLLNFDRNIYINSEVAGKRKSDFLRKEEVLFNNTNSQDLVGKSAYFDLDGEYFCSNHITRIGVKKDTILPKYLWIILNLYQEKGVFFTLCTNWNNQSGINSELLRTLKLPVPDLKTQHEIVITFSRHFDTGQNKERQADELLSSVNEVILGELKIKIPRVGYKLAYGVDSAEIQKKRLDPFFYRPDFRELEMSIQKLNHKQLGDIITFSNETWNQKDIFGHEFPYIEISEIDIRSGRILNISYQQKNNAPSRARMVVRENDIIVSTTRPHRGAISLIDKSKHGVIASTGFAILRDSKISINRDYLLYVLRSELSLQQMLQRSSGGNYPAITTEELKKVIIPLPPMLIQDKIAENVKARLQRAEQLQGEAKEELKVAKKEIEKGILG